MLMYESFFLHESNLCSLQHSTDFFNIYYIIPLYDRLSAVTSVISLIFRFNCLHVSSADDSVLLEDDVTGGFLATVPGCLLLCDAIACWSNGLVMAKMKK